MGHIEEGEILWKWAMLVGFYVCVREREGRDTERRAGEGGNYDTYDECCNIY